MSTATLSDIIKKVRKLTGTGNTLQLTDSTIVDYINSFYLYDFPEEFRSLHLKDVYTFNTIENVSTYPFDFVHYSTLNSPVYVDRRLGELYYNPTSFYEMRYSEQYRETFDSGDGTTGTYSGTLLTAPILKSYNNTPKVESKELPTATFATGSYPPSYSEPNPSRVQNILITAPGSTTTLNVTDDGAGNLIGDVLAGSSGTIDYDTGVIANLEFSAFIPSGNDIEISYQPSNQARPQAVLFYQNQLTLSPVPDKGYTIEIECNRRPSQVLLGSQDPDIPVGTGVPELLEWWECLAAGAAKKIFEDRQDTDGIMMTDKMLMERYAIAETRTYAQLGKQRIGTIFSDQLYGETSGGSGFGGGSYG